MNKIFFIKYYLLPAAFFSLVSNLLMLAPSFYMLQLFDRVISTRSMESLWLLTMLLFVALLVMSLLEVVRSRLLVTANLAIDDMLAPYLFNKMTEGASRAGGNPYSYALRDLHTIKSFLAGHGITALFDAPWLPVYMVVLYFMHPVLFYVILIGSAIMAGLAILSELLTKRPLDEAVEASRDASQLVESSIRNAGAANAMGMRGNLTKRWALLNTRVIALQTKANNRAGAVSGASKFARQMIQALAMGVGAYIILTDSTFTPGLMIAGGIIFGKALGPIEVAISSWKTLLDARSAYARLHSFVKAQDEDQTNFLELPPPTGQITLEQVTFGIRATNKVIVRDFSFSLNAGESLGIIGPSAAGKSSLARLLVGIWRPLQGEIRLDEAAISSWPSERLGQYLGYLPQDIELFAGTIAENIARLSEPETEKVLTAAKLAGLHETILHMPDGYDTQIGEGGAILSGGQRQRVALARAMYGAPRIIVLDEPNANLDSEGELALVNAMAHLKEAGTTTIVITHKLNLLANVDKLLVMQNGGVAAFGPKAWVMAQLTQAQKPSPPEHADQGNKVAHTANA